MYQSYCMSYSVSPGQWQTCINPTARHSLSPLVNGASLPSLQDVTFLVLLVGDFPQQPNPSLSHASAHTQQPTLSIIQFNSISFILRINYEIVSMRFPEPRAWSICLETEEIGRGKGEIGKGEKRMRGSCGAGGSIPEPWMGLGTRVRVRLAIISQFLSRSLSSSLPVIFYCPIWLKA